MSIEDEIVADFEGENFFNNLTCGQWDNANANAPLSPEGCRKEAELVIGEINRTEAKLRTWLRTALLKHRQRVLDEARTKILARLECEEEKMANASSTYALSSVRQLLRNIFRELSNQK